MPNGETRGGLPCPVCEVDLVMSERQGIEIDYCPKCRGVWLDRGELDKIIERAAAEDGRNALAAQAPPAPTQTQPQPQVSSPWPAPSMPSPAPYPPSYPDPYGGGHSGGRHGGHSGNHGGGYGQHDSFLGRLFR